MTNAFLSLSYLLASILFVFSIRGLASPETARRGNVWVLRFSPPYFPLP